MESTEYIPAQIFAEYFRYLYTYNGKPIDGIVYRSAKKKDGICYALFFDQNQCLPKEQISFYTQSHQQMLKMDKSSLSTYKVSYDIELEEIYYM